MKRPLDDNEEEETTMKLSKKAPNFLETWCESAPIIKIESADMNLLCCQKETYNQTLTYSFKSCGELADAIATGKAHCIPEWQNCVYAVDKNLFMDWRQILKYQAHLLQAFLFSMDIIFLVLEYSLPLTVFYFPDTFTFGKHSDLPDLTKYHHQHIYWFRRWPCEHDIYNLFKTTPIIFWQYLQEYSYELLLRMNHTQWPDFVFYYIRSQEELSVALQKPIQSRKDLTKQCFQNKDYFDAFYAITLSALTTKDVEEDINQKNYSYVSYARKCLHALHFLLQEQQFDDNVGSFPWTLPCLVWKPHS